MGSSSFDYRSLLPGQSNSTIDYAGADDSSSAEGGGDDECICCTYLPEMTWRERMIGCATCMVAGYLLSFGAFFRIKDLLIGNPMPFVLNATVGNMIALAGSLFLSGPRNQLRRMWHESRRLATTAYLGSLLLTLFVIFVPVPGPKRLYLLLFMLVQFCAIAWYCLSYVPFARDAVRGYISRRLSSDDDA